jgi:hypothetical protein
VFIIASHSFLSALEEVINFINDCYLSSTDCKERILMKDIAGKVAYHRSNIAEIRRMYREGTLFPQDPFAKVNAKAIVDGRNIEAIANANGFKVLDAYSNGNPGLNKIIIGDVHYRETDPEFLMHHPQIAGIIGLMMSRNLLNSGDTICAEYGLVEGKVNFQRSLVEPGSSKIAVDNCKNSCTITADPRHFIVRAFNLLDCTRMNVFYNGSAELGKEYDAKRAANTESETAQTEMELKVAFIKRVESFGESLRSIKGRAVQVFGLWDMFTEIVQRQLREAGESYITIAPEEGAKQVLEARR